MGDQLFIVCSEEDAPAIVRIYRKRSGARLGKQDLPMVSRRILVTKPEINGKTLGSMHFRSMYGVNVTVSTVPVWTCLPIRIWYFR